MASKPIPDSIKESILADWRTGEYSQRHIAQRYKVSLGVVNKITKGVDKSTAPIVNKLVEAKQELSQLDERTVNAVHEVVDSKVKWLEFLNRSAIKNVQQAMAKDCIDQQDFNYRAKTIGVAKEVIEGKNPSVAVQVNNNAELLQNVVHIVKLPDNERS